jgi:glycosyltransferase involved in cell wall biosynthesis
MLEIVALTLAGIHFGVPLAYYWYAKTRWLPKPWNIKVDEDCGPKITIIVPTYNESEFIEKKLEDLYAENYPKNLMETIVVDSESKDGTSEIAENWAEEHPDFNVKIIREGVRRGKLHALNTALKQVSSESEIVIFTDADAFWEEEALRKIVRYFSNPKTGSVTGNIFYIVTEVGLDENVYRDYYNLLRIAESKKFATPVHNGPLLAIRTKLLKQTGLPSYLGSDDSGFGSFIAFMGYRAIQADDVWVKEPVRGSQFRRKIRRAQHLLLNFLETKRYAKNVGVYVKSPFDKIWKTEWWLHLVNPWLLVASAVLLAVSAVFQVSITALALLGIGSLLLVLKMYRTWVLQQLYLTIAAVRNLWTKETIWDK